MLLRNSVVLGFVGMILFTIGQVNSSNAGLELYVTGVYMKEVYSGAFAVANLLITLLTGKHNGGTAKIISYSLLKHQGYGGSLGKQGNFMEAALGDFTREW
ncbi:hypothetical protein PQX77_019607 [Marasmius sp. AFHP31]|nr:hypothetical protein PQX77_019607 [Marasmius sp. AFHP31]